MASLKIEFETVRQLEKKSSKVFMYGGIGFVVGMALVFTPLMVLGVMAMALSAVVVLGAICYVSMLGREASKQVFCPYCSSKNDVYASRREFSCDICGRPVKFGENGEPLMAQEIDMTMRHNQKTEE